MRRAATLLIALLLAPLAALLAAESKPDNLPKSDCAASSKPLHDWKSGFLTGNGNMGVIMPGEPYPETLIINAGELQEWACRGATEDPNHRTVTLRIPPGPHVPPLCHELSLTKGKPAHVEIAITETETSQ
jgi:hypothetical protein